LCAAKVGIRTVARRGARKKKVNLRQWLLDFFDKNDHRIGQFMACTFPTNSKISGFFDKLL
jgi:hypothetical protein